MTRNLAEGAAYCLAGTVFHAASDVAQTAGLACLGSKRGREFLLFSSLCDSVSRRIFLHLLEKKEFPSSQSTWRRNRAQLLQIPALTDEMKQLLLFLERRWLAKANGFFPFVIDRVCPCYGISVQVHPDTTSCYARDPATQPSNTYENRVEAWKRALPHPHAYPLVLTRPCDIGPYLGEEAYAIADLTSLFPEDPNGWMEAWKRYEGRFLQSCKQKKLGFNRIICVQRLKKGEVGGLRLLPLTGLLEKEIACQYRFLLERVFQLGLTANPVELDRWPSFLLQGNIDGSPAHPAKEEFASFLDVFERNWKAGAPEKDLMLQGLMKILRGWAGSVPDSAWAQIARCPTRSKIVEISFSRIKEEFKQLNPESRFFDFVSRLEQIHAHFVALLEICSPFSQGDFPPIYRDLLPAGVKPFASCAVHSTGMTSLAGIFKAVEKSAGKSPRILYGENIYFENFFAAGAQAQSIDAASESDWKEADLILAQFNPALRRTFLEAEEYRAEKVEEILRKALRAREGKPLTAALDCTIDFLCSPRIAALFAAFQKEIEEGRLNFVCYRSGLKFDLFGMDHFCGAPFYMVHNQSPQWAPFEILLTDPALQTDRLSLNWFCLAYKYAAEELDDYRRKIFDNTRALLQRTPERLFDKKSEYRMIPFEGGADAGFIDFKIFGSFHSIRAAALVCACLFTECMESGHPVFNRRSLGFYHPNFSLIMGEKNSTIRLTLGLDPSQVEGLAQVFKRISNLEDSR